MPKIIFDCERMKHADNGLYHYCLNLGKHLQQTNDRLDEELFFYMPPSRKALFNNTNIILQQAWQKFWMPRLKGFDIWHGTYQSSLYIPKLDQKIKVVLTIHDLNFLYEENRPQWKKERNLQHVQKMINRADALVFISEFTQEDVRLHCKIGNKPQYLIHNGSNFLDTPVLHKASYKPKKPFLFSIGVIKPKKNFHTLVPLIKNKELELIIAGKNDDPHYHDYIKENAYKWGVQDDVHLLGSVTENEKAWYYKNCQAFAFPSISEGFGSPVVEAMSLGKPLFLSNRTALPEIGGDVSFYFQNFNAEHMQAIFTDGMKKYNSNGLRKKIIERGTEFCWKKAAQQYWAVYRSLYLIK